MADRHAYKGETNSRAQRKNSKLYRGIRNAIDVERLDELLGTTPRPKMFRNPPRLIESAARRR